MSTKDQFAFGTFKFASTIHVAIMAFMNKLSSTVTNGFTQGTNGHETSYEIPDVTYRDPGEEMLKSY